MANYYLMHHGVKGMKWGRRRYQNKDGSLTPAGEKRYERDIRENNAKKKDNRITIDGPDPSRWATEDTRRAKNTVDSTSNLVKELKGLDDSIPNRKQKKLDLSNKSEKEMREEINRALLERQYNDVFNPRKVSKGREVARGILETTGTVLAIGSSALGIALAVKELKG